MISVFLCSHGTVCVQYFSMACTRVRFILSDWSPARRPAISDCALWGKMYPGRITAEAGDSNFRLYWTPNSNSVIQHDVLNTKSKSKTVGAFSYWIGKDGSIADPHIVCNFILQGSRQAKHWETCFVARGKDGPGQLVFLFYYYYLFSFSLFLVFLWKKCKTFTLLILAQTKESHLRLLSSS